MATGKIVVGTAIALLSGLIVGQIFFFERHRRD